MQDCHHYDELEPPNVTATADQQSRAQPLRVTYFGEGVSQGVIVPSDEDLLASSSREVDAFGSLYTRYVNELLGFLVRRTADPQVAADLVAETFAAAFVARRKFQPQGPGSARAWLYGIARRVLGHYLRRQRVSDKYRRKLGMVPVVVHSDAARGRGAR